MSTILVIGATGQVGKKVCHSLLSRGYTVRTLVRDPDHCCDLSHPNLQIYRGNLADDFSDAFEGVHKVVFVAGTNCNTDTDNILLIDLWSAKRAIDYAEEEPSVEHFIHLSSFGADDPEESCSSNKPYLIAKHITDEYLTLSSVPYTILRPGKLTDDTGRRGFSSSRPSLPGDQVITRSDLADAICYCVDHDTTKIKVVELFNGEEALENVLN